MCIATEFMGWVGQGEPQKPWVPGVLHVWLYNHKQLCLAVSLHIVYIYIYTVIYICVYKYVNIYGHSYALLQSKPVEAVFDSSWGTMIYKRLI